MKLSLNFKQGTAVFKKLKQNISLALWAFLGVIAILTGYIIYGEVGKIFLVATDTEEAQGKIVRLNIALYQELEKKLDDNAQFIPQPVSNPDAFTYVPNKTT
jgi:hypothetical protein